MGITVRILENDERACSIVLQEVISIFSQIINLFYNKGSVSKESCIKFGIHFLLETKNEREDISDFRFSLAEYESFKTDNASLRWCAETYDICICHFIVNGEDQVKRWCDLLENTNLKIDRNGLARGQGFNLERGKASVIHSRWFLLYITDGMLCRPNEVQLEQIQLAIDLGKPIAIVYNNDLANEEEFRHWMVINDESEVKQTCHTVKNGRPLRKGGSTFEELSDQCAQYGERIEKRRNNKIWNI